MYVRREKRAHFSLFASVKRKTGLWPLVIIYFAICLYLSLSVCLESCSYLEVSVSQLCFLCTTCFDTLAFYSLVVLLSLYWLSLASTLSLRHSLVCIYSLFLSYLLSLTLWVLWHSVHFFSFSSHSQFTHCSLAISLTTLLLASLAAHSFFRCKQLLY